MKFWGFELRLIEDARKAFFKLWSIRIALFWGAVCGLYAAWSAFSESIPAPIFAVLSMIMCMAIAGARVTKQPGLDE